MPISDRIPEDGLSGGHLLAAVGAVSLAIFMAAMDITIANTALPTMAADLGATPADSVWIVNAYQLALVMSLLPFASLGRSRATAGSTCGGWGCSPPPLSPARCAARWSR